MIAGNPGYPEYPKTKITIFTTNKVGIIVCLQSAVNFGIEDANGKLHSIMSLTQQDIPQIQAALLQLEKYLAGGTTEGSEA